MSDMCIKKVFKQHNSLVVTLPVLLRRDLGIERGDHLVFEWDGESSLCEVYKWHEGVERSYADYGSTNLKDQSRRISAKGHQG